MTFPQVLSRSHSRILIGILLIVLLAGCERDHIIPGSDRPGNDAAAATLDSPSVEVGSELTIVGRLVNTACYAVVDSIDVEQSNTCSHDKTKEGFPVAVLMEDSQVHEAWILLTVPQIFTDYMDRTVRVQGTVRSDGVLIPVRVEVKGREDWTFIM